MSASSLRQAARATKEKGREKKKRCSKTVEGTFHVHWDGYSRKDTLAQNADVRVSRALVRAWAAHDRGAMTRGG